MKAPDLRLRIRLARFMRGARATRGLSAKAMAIVLWQDRTFHPLVYRIEHGRHTVNLETIDRWLAACGLPLVAVGPVLDGSEIGAWRHGQ